MSKIKTRLVHKSNIAASLFQFITITLFLAWAFAFSKNNYVFKQVMPASQWMDYSPDQPERAVILDGEGGAIVVSQAFAPNWLLVQKIDRYGNVLWAEPGQARKLALDMPAQDAGHAPILLSDENGGAYIAYAYSVFNEQDGDWYYNYDVYVQHIAENFERLWGDRGIAVAASASVISEYPYGLIPDGKGGLFILYSGYSERQGPYGTKYVQHINESGELLWPDLGIMLTKNDTTGVQRILPDDKGGAFLFGYVNYAQRMNHNGEFLWSLPFVKTGLPKLSKLWLYKNIDYNSPTVTLVGNGIHAQKIVETNGVILWGENGKIWEQPNEPIPELTVVTKNGKGGAYMMNS